MFVNVCLYRASTVAVADRGFYIHTTFYLYIKQTFAHVRKCVATQWVDSTE